MPIMEDRGCLWRLKNRLSGGSNVRLHTYIVQFKFVRILDISSSMYPALAGWIHKCSHFTHSWWTETHSNAVLQRINTAKTPTFKLFEATWMIWCGSLVLTLLMTTKRRGLYIYLIDIWRDTNHFRWSLGRYKGLRHIQLWYVHHSFEIPFSWNRLCYIMRMRVVLTFQVGV